MLSVSLKKKKSFFLLPTAIRADKASENKPCVLLLVKRYSAKTVIFIISVVDCLTLEYHHQALDDGDVVYLNGTTVFGSLLTATCRPGSKMFGDSARRCTLHGTWSGTRAWCIGEVQQLLMLIGFFNVHKLL